MVNLGSVYRHYKGGLYLVLHRGTDSTSGREGRHVIVYVSLERGNIRVRDEAEFLGRVTCEDRGSIPRYVCVG